MKVSHRQHKKDQTRQALITSALTLFEEQGYTKTTIAHITEKANCAPRTFFLYFRSKEDLLPAGIEQARDSLAFTLKTRGSAATLDALKNWILEMLANHADSSIQLRADWDKSLQLRKLHYFRTLMMPVLAKSFAEDLQLRAEDPKVKLAAAATVDFMDTFDFNLTNAQRIQFVDDSIAFLQAGIEQLRNLPDTNQA